MTKTKINRLLFLLFMIVVTTCTAVAQDNVSISVFQDVKFALKGDEARGYKAGTLDLLFRFKMQGEQNKYGYFVVAPEYEYADLDGIYRRYSVNVGYTLNQLILDNFEVTPMLNYGWIDRGVSTWSYGAYLELMYKLSDRFKIGFVNQLTHRTDLPNRKLGYSLFGGLEISLK